MQGTTHKPQLTKPKIFVVTCDLCLVYLSDNPPVTTTRVVRGIGVSPPVSDTTWNRTSNDIARCLCVNQRAPPPTFTARSDVERVAASVVTGVSSLPAGKAAVVVKGGVVVKAEAVVRAFAGPIPALR